jgi:DNA/RNA-binding domain of Phe-tRNA-synthetase-like protein
MEKINQQEMLEFIQEYYGRYQQVPCVGFLAGWYKVSMEAVRKRLAKLAKIGKVEPIYKEKNIVSYKLITKQ